MKAVLLAAGKGERLGDVTRHIPKPMIPLAGKPVIERNIELCVRHGIRDIFINLHYLADSITSHLGDGGRFGASITYAYEPELLGTAGGVRQFAPLLGDEPFFVIYADNYSEYDLGRLAEQHLRARAEMTIALFHLDDVRLSGVAVLDKTDRIVGFIEKPETDPPPSHWVNAGIYLLEPPLLAEIPAGFSDFGRDIIPGFLRQGRHIQGAKFSEKVIAIDTMELLAKAKTAIAGRDYL